MRSTLLMAMSIPAWIVAIPGDAGTQEAAPRTLLEWTFGGEKKWNGWSPNAAVRDINFLEDSVSFRTGGSDPQILSPSFDMVPAKNAQWVEIDLECDGGGSGELFYTNKTESRYGGLEPRWVAHYRVPGPGRRTVSTWPYWESLGKIIRVRFDPPANLGYRLHAIRIIETPETALGPPQWDFESSRGAWTSLHAAELEIRKGALECVAGEPQSLIITPVEPFRAGERSVLRIDARCPGEDVIGLYWVTREEPGLFGEPIPLREGKRSDREAMDLRGFAAWNGEVTHLAIGFGTHGGERLSIRSLSIAPSDPNQPRLRARYLGFEQAINRPGIPARIRLLLEHAGGPDQPPVTAVLESDGRLDPLVSTVSIPVIAQGGRFETFFTGVPRKPGRAGVTVRCGDQTFEQTLRIDPDLNIDYSGEYDVPPPTPVKTDYKIGVYYFPGWSRDQISRWRHQAGFPERDPILGWYEEGLPQVADWHIKWAAENGISFFLFDWYWREGQEDLAQGLNEGFLKARYCNSLQFALMWANHRPFADHTMKQLLEVTDYWIENYFRRPNYLMVDGKPYVSFFAPGELVSCLGGEEKVHEAFEAMRTRVREAGFQGLHIGACGGLDRQAFEVHRRAGYDSVTAYNYPGADQVASQTPYLSYLLAHEPLWERARAAGSLPYIPLLTVNWDSRPWHGARARAHFLRRTDDFKTGLARLKAFLDESGGKIALLEAWNEWGEGSYLEPNVEFGFEDLEAVREVFARRGREPQNSGPDDVGLGGRYDMRLEPLASGGNTEESPLPIYTEAFHPAVEAGMTITVAGSVVKVSDGKARNERGVWNCRGAELLVGPAETVEVTGVVRTLVEGPVQSWRGGNRLPVASDQSRNLLPGSFVPGSLTITGPEGAATASSSPGDFVVDDVWGAFAITEEGALKPQDKVSLSYRMSLRRIDALVLDASGTPRLIRGKPKPDCPEPPSVPNGNLHLANIYRPYHATQVEPHHVFLKTGYGPDLSPHLDEPSLRDVLRKLHRGGKVTIVCWGDSVTVGGDASAPERSYVGLFRTMLAERFPHAAITIVNAGIGGSSTRERFRAFEQEVLRFEPDLVTLEFVNDMGLPVEEMEERYSKILRQTREAGSALLLITPHYTRPEWMGLPLGRGRDPRAAVAFLRRFARTNRVPLADASLRWERLELMGIPYETLLKNGINHPDDRGHMIFAEELLRFFPLR